MSTQINILSANPYTITGGLYTQTASSTPVTNTIVETSLLDGGLGSLTVPANGFQVGDSFTASLTGHISCISSATLRIRVRASGGALLADTDVISLNTTTNKHWNINIHFTIRSLGVAGVASIASGGIFSYTRNGSSNFEGMNFSIINNTTFNTTISNTLSVTAQWGTANAGDSIYSEICTLYKTY